MYVCRKRTHVVVLVAYYANVGNTIKKYLYIYIFVRRVICFATFRVYCSYAVRGLTVKMLELKMLSRVVE